MRPETSRSCTQVPPPGAIPADNFVDSFIRLMDNMASAATNNKDVLEHLFKTKTTQYATIKALLQELKTQRGSNKSGRNPSSVHTADGDDMHKLKKLNAMLQHVITKGWSKVGFCSSHSHCVPTGHDSCKCPDRKPGHVETATRENLAGPAQYSNKGWDAFWT